MRKFSLGAFFDPSLIFPDFWEVGRCYIDKFHLYEVRPFSGWLKLISAFQEAQIKTQTDLADLSFAESTVLDDARCSKGT